MNVDVLPTVNQGFGNLQRIVQNSWRPFYKNYTVDVNVIHISEAIKSVHLVLSAGTMQELP